MCIRDSLYHDPLYNAAGFGFHAMVGVEYMLSANWGLGLTLNGVSGSMPKQMCIRDRCRT